MRNIQSRQAKFLIAVMLTTAVALVAGCGGREIKPSSTTTPTTPVSTAASIALSSTATRVKSDGSDSITLTAIVLDANNGALPNQTLTIASTAGLLSTSTAITDTTGKATFTFSGGTDGTNNTATITVTPLGTAVSKSVPIQITGSTLTLTTTTTSVTAGLPLTISISAKNAGGIGVAAQSLRYSLAATSTTPAGSVTLSAATGTTDAAGAATFNLTGTQAGNVDVLVEWLNAAGTVTASATKTITVSGAVGGAFSVTTPATSPFAVALGTSQLVVVNVPATAGPANTPVDSIRYSTSLGSWAANGSSVLTVPRAGAATNTQTFVPSIVTNGVTVASAGNASVQVDALDVAGNIITSVSFIFSISAPSVNAASITLQSNVSVLAPSVGTNLSTATFTAVVKDAAANPNPVGGANVQFTLVNSTGTGETISPVIVTTGANGQAQSTYTAGSSPTTQGAGVKATIVGTAISATAPITVGGTATSVSLGASTTIGVNIANTGYILPVTVIVSDSSGARVSGANVSLSLWPVEYFKGYRDALCVAQLYGPFYNEDANSNLILDPGEDIDGAGGFSFGNSLVIPPIPPSATYGPVPSPGAPANCPVTQHDCTLWPAPSTAGTIPSTVTTGVDGTATFDWVYLKQYANWVAARIRATIQVQGSQSTTNIVLPLTPAAADIKSPCSMPNSPFN